MSACEKCWTDSQFGSDYTKLLEARKDHPCTPEEQAGPDATECPECQRLTLHQHTGEPMCGCVIDREPPEPDGECYRGNEYASALAEEQARIQRELK